MAQKTQAQLTADIVATIYPNNARLVTATVVQDRMLDIVDSLYVDTASFATTTSLNAVTQSIVDLQIWSSSLVIAGGNQNLQDVTTKGATTTASVQFTNVTANNIVASFTGSLQGTAATASYFITSSVATASYVETAQTASAVDVLNQALIVTGSLQVSGSQTLILFGNLPISPAGLPVGALWNNGGVLQIVM